MEALAGGFKVGERICAPSWGNGTVTGLPQKIALKAVAVCVRWDTGAVNDERVNTLSRVSDKSLVESKSSPTIQSAKSLHAVSPDRKPNSQTNGFGSPGHTVEAKRPNTARERGETATRFTAQESWSPQIGDRIEGSDGKRGTVVGPASREALKAVCVAVQWDSADRGAGGFNVRPADARVSFLRPVPLQSGVAERPIKKLELDDLNSESNCDVEKDTSCLSSGESDDQFTVETPRTRANSQWCFHHRGQTVIIYDWDDTLFPTYYLMHVAQWDAKPSQHGKVALRGKEQLDKVRRRLAKCEEKAVKILKHSNKIGHVVVITLAGTGWVEQACQTFYPQVGEILRSLHIKVIHARDTVSESQLATAKKRSQAANNKQEEFWGLVKGYAISTEVERFYSQYEGQSWKNILSIGDSRFERYGLLAASTAYMSGQRLSSWDGSRPFSPSQQTKWQKIAGAEQHGHFVHLRVKCCKLVDDPDPEVLGTQLELVSRWLQRMVNIDEGFDLDLEPLLSTAAFADVVQGARPLTDLPKVALVDEVLQGVRPVTELPQVQQRDEVDKPDYEMTGKVEADKFGVFQITVEVSKKPVNIQVACYHPTGRWLVQGIDKMEVLPIGAVYVGARPLAQLVGEPARSLPFGEPLWQPVLRQDDILAAISAADKPRLVRHAVGYARPSPEKWFVIGYGVPGAGKTTFAREMHNRFPYLPKLRDCVNLGQHELIAVAANILFAKISRNRQAATHDVQYREAFLMETLKLYNMFIPLSNEVLLKSGDGSALQRSLDKGLCIYQEITGQGLGSIRRLIEKARGVGYNVAAFYPRPKNMQVIKERVDKRLLSEVTKHQMLGGRQHGDFLDWIHIEAELNWSELTEIVDMSEVV